jgi:23S rRNA (uridine2552-2'-O)-methyltransferase
MATRWYIEKKQEYYYNSAKKQGYRARSAFKLIQIQKKYRLLKRGDTVIDLGAAPGGWCQVIKEHIGNGRIIAVDIKEMTTMPGVIFLKSDITKNETIDYIKNEIENQADVLVSDLAPDITGHYSMDHAKSVWLCTHALKIATHVLKNNGIFLCKIFEGEELKKFINNVKNRFEYVKPYVPKASRKRSSEVYIIAKGFKEAPEPSVE